ncbi:MAG: hypothetical protein PHU71_07305 [Candidatus Gracilibacteria bacterium]|nr:hypothetical protein [Candidatus Gracilibacteria bacterium]
MKRYVAQNDRYFVVDTWKLLVFPGELRGKDGTGLLRPGENGIDFAYGRIPLSIRNDFLAHMRRLVPIKYIRQQVEEFARKFDSRTISVNIRSWPEPDNKLRAEILFKMESVYAKLDKEKESNFFVVSDSAAVLHDLVKRYGQRVIFYPKRTQPGDRGSKCGIQDALIDLLLLSKNKVLKASAFSTYSEMAWWFGGCQAEVENIENESDIEAFCKKNTLADPTLLIPGDLLERAESDKNGGIRVHGNLNNSTVYTGSYHMYNDVHDRFGAIKAGKKTDHRYVLRRQNNAIDIGLLGALGSKVRGQGGFSLRQRQDEFRAV